jgi:hypothetical protein
VTPRASPRHPAGVALDLQKQRQPFCCDFRIGQDIFDPGQLCFWQKSASGCQLSKL